jgi:hypothetical protein
MIGRFGAATELYVMANLGLVSVGWALIVSSDTMLVGVLSYNDTYRDTNRLEGTTTG